MELPSNRNYRGGRSAGARLTKPERVQVGRMLRLKAVDGDITAALALSNFALAEALIAHPEKLLSGLGVKRLETA